MLIVLGGLPGVGKTTLARELVPVLSAVHLRLDGIEDALRAAGSPVGSLGYQAAYAVAEDNLALGHIVIADSVNPVAATREAWLATARRANRPAVEVEVECSDVEEHRGRVEARLRETSGRSGPTWADVTARVYEPWESEHVIIDTAGRTAAESVALILSAFSQASPVPPSAAR